ncbi:PUA-like domain-containing protein [Lactarius hengduanensis]|nr:PUA-like domain-containing protein [Lactarius hengduanensis]
MPTTYEQLREENIARNKKLLEGLMKKNAVEDARRPQPNQTRRVGRKSAPGKPKKRMQPTDDDEIEEPPPIKRARPETPQSGVRRSQRNAGKAIPDYQAESQQARLPRLVTTKVGVDHDRDPNRPSGKRIHDPKTFGHIPGIPVGTWWESREAERTVAMMPFMPRGLQEYLALMKEPIPWPSPGGYEDDIDMGDYFTFTGSGGRALKGTKTNPKNLRTAPQSSDQSFEHSFNKALKISSETRKPVRVIRGFKLPSPYAPFEGYDGLYTVEEAWMEQGLNDGGFLVCKFAFRRVPGQPPLQVKAEGVTDDDHDDDSASFTA